MGKLQQMITTILSLIGLVGGAVVGYQTAGILGIVVFTPLGALAGLILGCLGWHALFLLEFLT